MNISKELLSAVLGEDVRLGIYTTVESDEDELVQHIMKIEIYGNRVSYWRYYMEWGDNMTMCKCHINIYELAHKCKEWAEHNGWFLYPCRNFESTFKKFGCSIMKPYYKAGKFSGLFSTDGYDERDYLADTEIQVVCNACQWILDNKDKLNG